MVELTPEMSPEMSLKEMQQRIHALNVSKGWWAGIDPTSIDVQLSKMMLIVSEVAEACEAARDGDIALRLDNGGKPEGVASELADVVIRTLDLAHVLGIDLGTAIAVKHRYNRTRKHRHGGRLA